MESHLRHRLYRITANVLAFALLLGLVWLFRGDFGRWAAMTVNQKYPCARPVIYHVARLDPGFDLSVVELETALAQAEALWESALGRNLLERTTDGRGLGVSLIYDERQAVTQKLAVTGDQIDQGQAGYEQLKARHAQLVEAYDRDRVAFAERRAAFEAREQKFIDEVESWNRRGGAPPDIYDQLTVRQAELDAMAAELNRLARELNEAVVGINDLVDRTNRLADQLNLEVERFNRIAETRGTEYQEGQYRVGYGLTEIHVFEFESVADLTRVLAHEFGHALGLEHLAESGSLMYYLNSGHEATLSSADLAAGRQLCAAADDGGWRLRWLVWLAKQETAWPIVHEFLLNLKSNE